MYEHEEYTQTNTTINRHRIPNANFYPIQSRSNTMDEFQIIIERELTKLDNVPSNTPIHNLPLTVVMNRELYENLLLDMLSDVSTYRKLPCDPTKDITIVLELIFIEGVTLAILSEKQNEFSWLNTPSVLSSTLCPKPTKMYPPLPSMPHHS